MSSVNWPRVGWRAVTAGALAGLAVLGPAVAVAWLAAGDGAARAWSLLYLAAGSASFVVAGGTAGWRRSDTPILHGAAAAGGVYLVAAALAGARAVASNGTIAWLAVPVMVLLACCAGAVGGLGADWLRRRRRRAGSLSALGESAG